MDAKQVGTIEPVSTNPIVPSISMLWAAHKRIDRSWRRPRHRHSWWQCIYVVEGSLTVIQAKGEASHLSGGESVLLPPYFVHGLACNDDTEIYEAKFNIEPESWLYGNLLLAKPLLCTSTKLGALMELLMQEGEARQPYCNEMASLHIGQALLTILRSQHDMDMAARIAKTLPTPPAVVPTVVVNHDVRVIIDYMAANMHRNFTLQELASHFGYHPAYFCQAFSKTVGMPPMRYLTALRQKKAEELLAGSDYTITAIAETVGYKSSKQFWRAFRNATGMSPRAYRLQYGNSSVKEIPFCETWPQLESSLETLPHPGQQL